MSSSAPVAQASDEKLKPLVEKHRAMWSGFLRAATYVVIGVAVLLGLMATFLLKH